MASHPSLLIVSSGNTTGMGLILRSRLNSRAPVGYGVILAAQKTTNLEERHWKSVVLSGHDALLPMATGSDWN